MSSSVFSEESLLCQFGFLEKGDVVRYRKHGKEMEAFFVAGKPGSAQVKIRKTSDYYDYIPVSSIKEKVENPDISEGYRKEEGENQ